jgi:magnesium transporter
MPVENQSADRLPENLEWVQRLLSRHEHLLLQLAESEHASPKIDDGALEQILRELSAKLEQLHSADVAHILEGLPKKRRLFVWDLVKTERDGDILLEVSDAVRESLIESMDDVELVAAVEFLDADEVADLAPDLPDSVVDEVLDGLDAEERAQVQSALSYEDREVGAVMDFDLVSIRADVSCEVVLRYLRLFDELPRHTDKIFVVDDDNRLQGVLPIRRLLVADGETEVYTLMSRNVVSFLPSDLTEAAAEAFERYDLITAPVVDAKQHLIGRLTIDAMVDVIRENSDQDVLQLAGLKEEEDLFAPVIDSVRNRWAWLAINLGTAFVASSVIKHFDSAIEQLVALAALMPIVAGIGGNSGNQTITMIVRSLAMGNMDESQAWHLWRKELGVSLVNGLIWGGAVGVIAGTVYSNVALGLVIMSAMTLNLMLAATMGVWIPTLMHRFGKDPAVGSSVLITACTDSGGFFIFLGLASVFLLGA